MKILELAPYALIPGQKAFERNRSGLAVAIGDICKTLAKDNDVLLLTHSAFTKETSIEKIHVLRKQWFDVLVNLRLKNVVFGIKACNGLSSSFLYKLKVMLYFLTEGYVEKLIRKIRPDVAHIHTISFYSIPFMMACVNCGIPFVVTLHGVISYLDHSSIDEKQRKLEKLFCELADKTSIPITVVSSGVKKRLLNSFDIKDEVFHVVLNGYQQFNKPNKSNVSETREQLGIPEDAKLFMCVSSITRNKNQTQIVRAFNLLDQDVKDNAYLIFVGDGPEMQALEKEISKYKENDRIQCCGRVQHSEMSKYYSIADINVTASFEEGFGLPIIEAMSFGVPTVVYDDLDAVEDLYNEESMIKVTERSDEALSLAMKYAYEKEWNSGEIERLSSQFTCEQMAARYESVFQHSTKTSITTTIEDLSSML